MNEVCTPAQAEREQTLIELLASTRYMLFAENDFCEEKKGENGNFLQRSGALLPTRQKPTKENGSLSPEDLLGQKEAAERLIPFSPLNSEKRQYFVEDQINEDLVANGEYSKRFFYKTDYEPKEILGDQVKSMSAEDIERWSFQQLQELKIYGITSTEINISEKDIRAKKYSTTLAGSFVEKGDKRSTTEVLNIVFGERVTAMSPEELEIWAYKHLKKLAAEKKYIQDFTSTVRSLRLIIVESMRKSPILEQKINKVKGLKAFSKYVASLKKHGKERQLLAKKIEDTLLEKMVPLSKDDPRFEEEKQRRKRRMNDLANKANLEYQEMIKKYLPEVTGVQFNAESQNCENIGELFLLAFDEGRITKIRRESIMKLLDIIIKDAIEDHSEDSKGAMDRMTDILNEYVFVRKENEKIGHLDPAFLISHHAGEAYEADAYEIVQTRDNATIDWNESTDLKLRYFKFTSSDSASEKMVSGDSSSESEKLKWVQMLNRTKNRRSDKIIRENLLPGQDETDIYGFKFVIEDENTYISLRDQIIGGIQSEIQERLNERKNEADLANAIKKLPAETATMFFRSLLGEQDIFDLETAQMDEEERKRVEALLNFENELRKLNTKSTKEKNKKGQQWLEFNDPVPISKRTRSELASLEAIDKIGFDVTKAPIFITEYKDNLTGRGEFEGRDANSANLAILKFKLHIVKPNKPDQYDIYEFQFVTPISYANLLHSKEQRHSVYEIRRIFNRVLPMWVSKMIHGVNHGEEKKKALKREVEQHHRRVTA